MFVQLILFTFFFPYCLTIKSYGICRKINLCRNNIEPCHPVVIKCQNGSCRYRNFRQDNDQRLNVSRWFYDSDRQRCRRYNNQINDFVNFRFLRDCRRLCPIIRRKNTDQIVTLHVSEMPTNYNHTVYAHLYIDTSPVWIQTLADRMNISTLSYHSHAHYFRNYRRRFTNFIDAPHQLMHDRQQSAKKIND